MILRNVFLTPLMLCLYISAAQNLVINPGLESGGACLYGNNFGPNTCTGWDSSLANYFNACALSPQYKTPTNFGGYQVPRSGSGYGSILCGGVGPQFIDTDFIENNRLYLLGTLSRPLMQGEDLCVSFYISLSDTSVLAGQRLGVYFSDTLIALTGVPLPLSPQIVTPTGTYFTDKTNWVRISGLYHARGGGQLIYIGNFDDQQQLIKVKQYYDGIGTRNFCMYYVDDVAVVPLSDVFLHPLPADTTVCDTTGMSMLLSVPAGVYDSLRWSDGSTTQQLQITAPGIYYIDGWSGDCHARDSITISFTPPLILGITHTDMQACADAFPVPIQAPPGYSAYYWSTGDTSAAIPAAVSGLYTVQLRDGCSSYADTFRLSSVPLPAPPRAADTSFCRSEVHGAISATGDSLRWYADGTGNLLPAAPVPADSPAHQFYYVTQTVVGCESAPSGVRVTILSPPPAVLGADQVHCAGVAVPIGSTAGAGTSYRWSTGDTSAQITVTAAGSYSRTATNLCGTITETVAIGLTDCDSACIYAPNAFTPNGDGTNDAYKVYTRCPFRFFEIRIFDRWGEQLYQSYDIGDAWDGSYRGQALEPGVFVYHLFLTTEEGNTEMHKGSVTLIR